MTQAKDFYDDYYLDEAQETFGIERVRATRTPRVRNEGVLAAVPRRGTGLLEIGCGSGELLLTVADRFERLVGIELSESRVAGMRETLRGVPNIDIRQGDVEAAPLPFPDGHFDVVVLSAVVEHLVDPIPALRECRRLVSGDGTFIIVTPNVAKWTRRIKLACGRFPSTASLDEGLLRYDKKTPTVWYDNGHLHYFTYRSLERVLRERAGFGRIERGAYGSPWPLVGMFPTLFSDVLLVCRP